MLIRSERHPYFASITVTALPRPQDKYHLYFLFDLMTGGDLMDVLVAEAKVIKRRIPQGTWRRSCFAPKVPRPDPAPREGKVSRLLKSQSVSTVQQTWLLCRESTAGPKLRWET